MSGGCRGLSLDEFFYCYKPQEILTLKDFYNFTVQKLTLKLVYDMPDPNRYWKSRYFFVEWGELGI